MSSGIHKFGSVVGFIFNKLFLLCLILFILVMVPVTAISSTLTNRETVKNVLSEANAYENVIDNFLDIVPANFDEGESDGDESSQTEKTLRQLIEENGLINADELLGTLKNNIDPAFFQATVETVLDATYDFLDQTSDDFTFELTIQEKAGKLAADFKTFALSTLDSIPVCTPQQAQQLTEETNILEAPCLPPNTGLEDQIDSFISELSEDDSVFTATYTQDDLDISSVDLEGAELVYDIMTKTGVIFWIGFIGLAAVGIMTAKTTHRGFKEVGVISFIIGLVMLIGLSVAPSASTVIDNLVNSQEDISAAQITAIEKIVEPIANELESAISGPATTQSIILMVVGLVLFGGGILLTRLQVEHMHMPHLMHHPKDNIVDPKKNIKPTGTVGSGEQLNDTSKKSSEELQLSDVKPVSKKVTKKD